NERRHLMDSAVVFRNLESSVETASRIKLELPERQGRFGVFLSFEMIVILDDPATTYCSPLELDGFSCRQIRSCDVNLGIDDCILVRKSQFLIRLCVRWVGLLHRTCTYKKRDKQNERPHDVRLICSDNVVHNW